ncbi:TA system VapC family ribonuclease toxin [Nocardioides baekrokdamisoli]|uniref:TA system VapC family ribonuclease toxin n=1 Tax=Nocardioides baekrokdamisoli TaxID=1804624 RepID=UPI0013DE2CF2|nr:TA system VapC family ribonuclease toxin [Nocardioides baekrokdamisoli]
MNVLVALFHEDGPEHARARAWWDESVRKGEPFTVPDVAWTGFLRVVTNRRLYDEAPDLAQAWAFVRAMSAHPQCLKHVPGPDTLMRCETATTQARRTGPDISDAYLAAVAMDYGATVVTFDRDFRKFDDLRVTELA